MSQFMLMWLNTLLANIVVSGALTKVRNLYKTCSLPVPLKGLVSRVHEEFPWADGMAQE